MKKRVISIVTFLVLFIVGFIYLNKVFISEHNFVNSIEDFKELSEKTNIDVMFYGSSLSYTMFNPLIINKECKTISFNFGSPSLYMELTDLIFEETLKYNKPKLIVLSSHFGTFLELKYKRQKGHQLWALNFVPNISINKWQKVTPVYKTNEYLSVAYPLIRNHNKWHDKDFLSLSRRKDFTSYNNRIYNLGYVGFFDTISEGKELKYFNEFLKSGEKRNTNNKHIYKNQKAGFLNFVKIAKQNSVEVLVVTPPSMSTIYADNTLYSELIELCEVEKVPYLNMNTLYKELDLKPNEFRDHLHPNYYGNVKVSKYLSNYINKNFTLPDRSSEIIWKDYKKQLDSINDKIHLSNKTFKLNLNKPLNDIITVNSVHIERKFNKMIFKLKLDETKGLTEELSKYKLAVKVHPTENELNNLSENSKSKNRDYDGTNVAFDKNAKEVIIGLNTKIKKIKKIKIFLYNKEGYKGVVGQPIIIEDLTFELQQSIVDE
ncbi:MAG: hypothetical protein ABFS35_20540 [Bacteroidota bacterium]